MGLNYVNEGVVVVIYIVVILMGYFIKICCLSMIFSKIRRCGGIVRVVYGFGFGLIVFF